MREDPQSSYACPPPESRPDYVIIGSGSSGAALAGRLAEITDARILVLEAGGNDDLREIADPRLWADSLETRAAADFVTEPQIHADARVHAWPRGRVFGGSSAVNAMVFARGHPSDFDGWAAEGCKGWAYADVLPAFKAMESWEFGPNEWRGGDGPLSVVKPAKDKRHPGAEAFMAACNDLGFEETPDSNGARMEGQHWVDMNLKEGIRHSAASAFLRPQMRRNRVQVLTDAPVISLDFEGSRCIGVSYLHGGRPVSLGVEEEVVLCAGALESPRMLMLAGIGPSDQLSTLGIPVRADLPVGIGLQDHILGAGVNYASKGPLPESHYQHSEVYMWERSDAALPAPDIITLYVSRPFATAPHRLDIPNGYAICSGLARPHARGTVRLSAADPTAPLRIDPNYLSDPRDWQSYRTATELCREIGAQHPYDDVRATEVLPGRELTDAEWRTFLGRSLHTYFHPTSTCRMGRPGDSVVGPDLRVHGIEGLRVADASVMPTITTSNTNAPSMMIGWRCAEFVQSGRA
jgi:choline dehydrogenase